MYLVMILIALYLVIRFWRPIMRRFMFVNDVRGRTTDTIFAKALLKELDKHISYNHNKYLRESHEKLFSTIEIRLDEYDFRKQLVEFDMTHIIKRGTNLGIFNNVTELIKDSYLGFVDRVVYDLKYKNNEQENCVIVTITIVWKQD